MIYGHKKVKEMANSVTGKAFPEQKSLVRATRHAIKQELAQIARDPESAEDSDADLFADSSDTSTGWDYPSHGNHYAGFLRWAASAVKNTRPDDRLSKIRATVPPNTGGADVARWRLGYRDGFENTAVLERRENDRRFWLSHNRSNVLTTDQKVALLRKIAETHGFHRLLNLQIARWHRPAQRKVTVTDYRCDSHPANCNVSGHSGRVAFEKEVQEKYGPGPRYFLGPGDEETLLVDLDKACEGYSYYKSSPGHHPEWRGAVVAFLEFVNREGFDYETTRRFVDRLVYPYRW
jgi:hypothetical protein